VLGLALLAIGLLVTSIAFVTGGGEGLIVIFPFVFGNLDGWTGIALTLVFACAFMAMSMLPFFLFSRDSRLRRSVYVEGDSLTSDYEKTDYVITIEVPQRLRKTIYIEGQGNMIYLKSRADKTFHRMYPLPHGFVVEDYHQEFDGGYLVLRLKLKRMV